MSGLKYPTQVWFEGKAYVPIGEFDEVDQRIAALESERDALKQRAEAAEGLAGALEDILDNNAEGNFNEVIEYAEQLRDNGRAALAAYKQAGGK
jgi:hypothetical protein